MDRAVSVLFYIALAFITCIMAANVKPVAAKTGTGAYGTDAFDRRNTVNHVYIAGIFALLFLVSALRFDIGNDYEQYTLTAHEAYVGGYVVTEVGFNILVRAVYTLFYGECYEVIFACLQPLHYFFFCTDFIGIV